MRCLVHRARGLIRRQLAGFFAIQHMRGDIQVVARHTGLGYKRIQRGMRDLIYKEIALATNTTDSMYVCTCELCRLGVKCSETEQHRQINFLMHYLDDDLRRWFAGYLATHYDNAAFVAIVTGLSEKTIRRGKEEMTEEMQGCDPGIFLASKMTEIR